MFYLKCLAYHAGFFIKQKASANHKKIQYADNITIISGKFQHTDKKIKIIKKFQYTDKIIDIQKIFQYTDNMKRG